MKKSLLVCIFILNFIRESLAQIPIVNLQKYWFYHDRLTHAFVYVGDGPGESLVAAGRGPGGDALGWGTTVLGYGEDQTVHLGWYIAVLATEYALEHQYGLDQTQTKKELFYALQAFNRIDIDAEWYYRADDLGNHIMAGDDDNNGYSDDLNGFFTRNDIGYSYFDPDPASSMFIANHKDEYMSSPGFSLLNLGTGDAPPDWNGSPPDRAIDAWHLNKFDISNITTASQYFNMSESHHYTYEMSKDQVNLILLGLAFVKKCVLDDGNDYYEDKIFLDNETNFVQEAKNIAERLWNSWNGWGNDLCIENAVTFMPVQCCSDEDYDYCGPGDPGGIVGSEFAYAKAINYITEYGMDHYLTWAGQELGKAVWSCSNPFLDVAANWPICNDDPLFKWCLLTAIGHSSYASIPINEFPFCVPGNNNSQAQLCEAVQAPGIWGGYFDSPILPLIHAYLHDQDLNCFDPAEYLTLLYEAPCQGPYNFSRADITQDAENGFDYSSHTTCQCNDLGGTHGGYWSSPNTFEKPEEREANIDEDKQHQANSEYNGLDYMLLYNLYCLYYGFPTACMVGSEEPLIYSDQMEYNNLLNYEEQHDYPLLDIVDIGQGWTALEEGTTTYPKVVHAYYTLSSDKSLGAGGSLTYNWSDPGGSVQLPANIDAGAFFEAFQDPFPCNSILYQKQASNNHSSGYYAMSNHFHNAMAPQAIDSSTHHKNLIIYPNPASQSVTIDIGDNGNYSLQISDMYGKPAVSQGIKGPQYSLDISNLTPGFYYLQVSDIYGEIVGNAKLVVQ